MTHRSAAWRYFGLLAVTIGLVISAIRILTYANVLDPSFYNAVAREIVASNFSLNEILHVSRRLAPGFPLLLAACIKIFGPYSPAWINLVFAIAYVGLLAILLKKLFNHASLEAIVLIGTFVTVLAGYYSNIHFLLYAFRAMPALFFTMLGLCLIVPIPLGERRPMAFLCAGLSMVAAMSMREPSALGFSGALLWLVSGRSRSKKSDLVNLGLFFMPLLLCALAWVLLQPSNRGPLNGQIRVWLYSLTQDAQQGSLSGLRVNLGMMLSMVHEEVGVPGYVLLLAGIYMLRRRIDVLLLFLLPAVLYWLFYSVTFAHRRYVLDGLMFLSPLIGCGFYQALMWIDALRRRLEVRIAFAIEVPALILLIAVLGLHIGHLKSVGRQHTREHIVAFQRETETLIHKGDALFCELPCRYLSDVCGGFTKGRIEDAARLPALIQQGVSGYYFKALNAACLHEAFYNGGLRRPYISVESRIQQAADLRPVLDAHGDLREILLRDARFGVYRIEPWTQTMFRTSLKLRPSSCSLYWMDFRNISTNCSEDIRLIDSGGNIFPLAHLEGRGGIHGVIIPPELTSLVAPVLEVQSSCGLPPSVFLSADGQSESISFKLDGQRLLSTHAWIQFPLGHRFMDRYIGHFSDTAQLLLPMPAGEKACAIEITVSMFRNRPQQGRATFHYEAKGVDLLDESVDLETTGDICHTIRVSDYEPGQDLPVSIRVESPEQLNGDFYLYEIRYKVMSVDGAGQASQARDMVRPSGDSLGVQVSGADVTL